MQFWKVKILSYISSVLRYRWYALGVAWVICLAGWSVVAVLPDEYRAEARVYIDTDSLMDPLLKGLTVTTDSAQEIAIMLRALITRPTLEQVIHLTDSKSDQLTPAQMEQRVLMLQTKISIRQLETKNYYAIGYSDNNPVYATAVTQTLLSILQDNRIGTTRLDMDSVRTFINKQITDYEQRLRDADKRRADFRTANIEIIGKGAASNRIDAAETARETSVRELNAAVARRNSLKTQIAATPKQVSMDERMFPGAGGGAGAADAQARGGAAASNPLQRLRQAQTQLEELRTRFTDNYPDVISTKDLIKRLEAQINATATDSNDGHSVMVTNPMLTQLMDKLSNEETNIAAIRQRITESERDVALSKKDASKAIDVMTQFNGLDRDYGNIEHTYQSLLESREHASLSQARDDQDQGVSFRVLDPPQRPRTPAAPNRPVMNTGVLFIGLAGGAALAVLLSLTTGQFLTSDDLANHFGVPLVGVITAVPTGILRGGRLSMVVLSASLALLIVSYLGVLALLQTSIYTVFGA